MRAIRSTAATLLSVIVLAFAFGTVYAMALGVGSPVTIALTPSDSRDPAIAYGNNVTHVVWAESGQILYSYNTGPGWTVPITVADGDEPSIVVDHNGIPHVAFTEQFNAVINVYHTRYVSSAWTLPQLISLGTNNTAAPDIAVAPDNKLIIVWSEVRPLTTTKQIEISESTNGGVSWPTVEPIPGTHGGSPKVAIGSDDVTHVVWQDDAASPFHINHVQRLTSAWSIQAILSDASAASFTPELATRGGTAHVVWKQSNVIKYTSGADISFSQPVTISTANASEPSIAATSYGALIAAWELNDTSSVARMGGPAGWGAQQTLSSATDVKHVALTTGPTGSVYAAFASGTGGNHDIVFNDYATGAIFLPLTLR